MKLSVLALTLIGVFSQVFVVGQQMLDLEAINELPQIEAAPSADDISPDDMTVYITEVLTPYFEHLKSKGNLLRQGKSFDN